MNQIILNTKIKGYRDFYNEKIEKFTFTNDPSFDKSNVWIEIEEIEDKKIFSFFKVPAFYLLNNPIKKNIISKVCYTKPIKPFFIINQSDFQIASIIVNVMNSHFSNYVKHMECKLTTLGFNSLLMMDAKRKKKFLNKELVVIIFNYQMYFINFDALKKFMRKILQNCGPNIPCSQSIVNYYEQFYGLPLFNNNNFKKKNLSKIEDGLLQFIHPNKNVIILS